MKMQNESREERILKERKKERKQPRGDVKSRKNPMNEARCKSTSVDNMLVRIMMIGLDMHMPSDDAF